MRIALTLTRCFPMTKALQPSRKSVRRGGPRSRSLCQERDNLAYGKNDHRGFTLTPWRRARGGARARISSSALRTVRSLRSRSRAASSLRTRPSGMDRTNGGRRPTQPAGSGSGLGMARSSHARWRTSSQGTLPSPRLQNRTGLAPRARQSHPIPLRSRSRHWHRRVQARVFRLNFASCLKFRRLQALHPSRAAERAGEIAPEKPLSAPRAPMPMLSPSRIPTKPKKKSGRSRMGRTLAHRKVAVRVGFEPTGGCPPTVFKTAAFDRSATSPMPSLPPNHRRCFMALLCRISFSAEDVQSLFRAFGLTSEPVTPLPRPAGCDAAFSIRSGFRMRFLPAGFAAKEWPQPDRRDPSGGRRAR